MTFATKLPALLLVLAACLASPRASDGPRGFFDGPGGAVPGPGSGLPDSGRTFPDPRDRALQFHGQLASRLSFLSGRFEGGVNPRALELADKIRSLLSRAMVEIEAGRPELAFPMLHQAERLCAELGRLSIEPVPFDPNTGPGQLFDIFKERRPAVTQHALADAWALHRRLQEHLFRLRDRPAAVDDRARSLLSRVQDLLDKSKESLVSGKADAGRELALKAEALLAELHLAVAGGPGASGEASRLRLEERLQRVSEALGRQPGSDGADHRRSGAAALLEQARDALAAGKADAAEAALKQAEKLLGAAGSPAGGKLGEAAFERLRSKLEKAEAIVKASGDGKAARILEKGLEHFDKAGRFRADGQAVRAEAEMDIALKLAAKAVDIARAAGR